MRVPGGRTSGPLAGDTVEEAIVQNKANFLGAVRVLIAIDRGAGMSDKKRDARPGGLAELVTLPSRMPQMTGGCHERTSRVAVTP